MKVPATPLGKASLASMLLGQLVLMVAIALWSPLFRGLEWNTRALVGGVAIGGAVLYFAGRGMQILARRRASRDIGETPPDEDPKDGN